MDEIIFSSFSGYNGFLKTILDGCGAMTLPDCQIDFLIRIYAK